MSAVPQIDRPDDIGRAYQYMVRTYGKEILREPRRAVGAMADMAPKLSGEIRALGIALQEKIPALLESDRSGKKAQTENAKRAVELLKQKGLSEDEAFSVVENLGDVLGIEMQIRPDYSQGGEIPYEAVPGNATIREAMNTLNHIRWFLNHEKDYTWTGDKSSLTELRRLLNHPKKNRAQIEELYKKTVRTFVNNPYENSFILEETKNQGAFATDRFEDYFLVIDDVPVPVGFAKQYPGTDTSRAMSAFSRKKTLFLDKVNGLKKNYQHLQPPDKKSISLLVSSGRRFILFSLVFVAAFGYLARDIVLQVDFRMLLELLKGYEYNVMELIKAYAGNYYAERYFIGCGIGAVMVLILVLLLLSLFCTFLRGRRLKKALSPAKKADKAMELLEKKIPEQAEGLEKSMKDYWGSKTGSLSLKKYDHRSALKQETASNVRLISPVKKGGKRLRALLVLSCILLFLGSRNGFISDIVMGSSMMGGVPLAQSPVLSGNGIGKVLPEETVGRAVASFSEADPSELIDVPRVNIADCSQSSYRSSQKGYDYTVRSAMDQNDGTSWQEGVDGNGEGESFWFALDQEYKVQYITLKLGSWKSAEAYVENGRPGAMTISVGGISVDFMFPDEQREFVLKLDHPLIGSEVKFTVNTVYPGSKWPDTCVTDVGIYGVPQDDL